MLRGHTQHGECFHHCQDFERVQQPSCGPRTPSRTWKSGLHRPEGGLWCWRPQTPSWLNSSCDSHIPQGAEAERAKDRQQRGPRACLGTGREGLTWGPRPRGVWSAICRGARGWEGGSGASGSPGSPGAAVSLLIRYLSPPTAAGSSCLKYSQPEYILCLLPCFSSPLLLL